MGPRCFHLHIPQSPHSANNRFVNVVLDIYNGRERHAQNGTKRFTDHRVMSEFLLVSFFFFFFQCKRKTLRFEILVHHHLYISAFLFPLSHVNYCFPLRDYAS